MAELAFRFSMGIHSASHDALQDKASRYEDVGFDALLCPIPRRAGHRVRFDCDRRSATSTVALGTYLLTQALQPSLLALDAAEGRPSSGDGRSTSARAGYVRRGIRVS